ncbi:MAG: ATP-binding protein, partial [Planctomycetota bacterium]
LVSANGLRHGHLKTQRRCVPQREIEELVMEATAASLANHGIDLLFDGVESRHDYFVDPNVVTRLLINLVINAQDAIAAAEQSRRTILVRVADILDKGVACWSVIDTGCGMSTSSLQRLQLIASWDTSSIGTGHGLGMMISRQLAGLLFSNLTIRSRLGAGTEVSFETPLNHPSAIATAFARHRQQFRQQTVNVERQSDATQVLDESSIGIADDVAGMVELAWFGSQPRRPDRLAMGCVHLEPSCSHSIADRFDAWFQSLLTPFELAVRTSRRRWVWALDADDHHIGIRIDRIAERAEEAFGQPLLSFDEPMITSTRARNLQTLLIDRMTTAALSAAASVPGTPDEVRLGTEPIHASPVATARLDKELSRLTKRMRRQADRLKQQASAIRPS